MYLTCSTLAMATNFVAKRRFYSNRMMIYKIQPISVNHSKIFFNIVQTSFFSDLSVDLFVLVILIDLFVDFSAFTGVFLFDVYWSSWIFFLMLLEFFLGLFSYLIFLKFFLGLFGVFGVL